MSLIDSDVNPTVPVWSFALITTLPVEKLVVTATESVNAAYAPSHDTPTSGPTASSARTRRDAGNFIFKAPPTVSHQPACLQTRQVAAEGQRISRGGQH